MNKKVLIIIPAYNEEECILKTCKKIDEYNKKSKNPFDYIVINDGSTDKTEDILTDNQIPHIKLIENLGIGGAVQTGYKYAYKMGYDIAVQYDGDGQHDIDYVEKIVEPITNGKYSMCIGSRFIKDDKDNFKSTKLRRVGINLISSVMKLKTNVKVFDTTSGFRAIDKKVMKMFVNDYPTEFPEPISTVNVLLNGLLIKEIPVKMKPREAGKSSISSLKSAYYMINVTLSILFMKGSK